ncbi:LOW QUALITY PROTEIN: hypothetical protein U9M48_029167 [Paspalum notatum var. saurae]|uniref:Uncharacterized protein n=1 Tax=Paspalum notatum var. saurae TaxID=547442 RepID=A0AAQ3TYA7_PASNO
MELPQGGLTGGIMGKNVFGALFCVGSGGSTRYSTVVKHLNQHHVSAARRASPQPGRRRDVGDPVEQHVVPHVDGAGQAPVQAVAGVPHPPLVVVAAGVAVGAQHHRLGDVQHPEPPAAPGAGGLLPHPGHLLALHPPQLPPDAPRAELGFLQRPRPVAVAAAEPGAVLEVVRRVGAQEGDEAGLAVAAPCDGLERRPDDAAHGVGDAKIREVGLAAVDAADSAAALPEVVDAEEPVAAGDDGVVEPREAAGPVGAEPVEVDVEGRRRLAVGVEDRLRVRNSVHIAMSVKSCAGKRHVRNLSNASRCTSVGVSACERRQSSDSIWLRASESPMNASVFPRATSRNRTGSNRGRSQPAGCHLQKRWPGSLPYFWQFLKSGSVGHVRRSCRRVCRWQRDVVCRRPITSGSPSKVLCVRASSAVVTSKPCDE